MVNATYRGSGGRRAGGRFVGRGWTGGLQIAAAALGLSLASLLPCPEALAQAKKKGNEASAQKDTAGIQRAYAAGTKAFEAGDMAGAEQQLSVALTGGGLPNAQMARALYLRGAALRRLGKPAQAISDLTTAVWLKGGLSDADKAKATEERQLAYREAGLGDTPPPIGAAPLDQSPKTPGAPAPAAGAQVVQVTEQSFWSNFSLPSLTGGSSQPAATAPAAATTQTADSGQQSGFWSFLSGGSSQSAEASQAAAPTSLSAAVMPGSDPALQAPAAAPVAHSAWDTQTAAAAEASAAKQLSTGFAATTAPAPAPVASYGPAPEASGLNPLSASSEAASSESVSNPLAGTGTAVSNFFGNIFGSGATQTAQAEPASAMTTGASGPAWGADTTVVTAQTSSMVQRGPDSPPPADTLPWSTPGASAATPAAPVKVAAAEPVGKYKLQVAAVRSREEAERLAQTLNGYPPVRDGKVSPEIDEAVIGSMGTFYRVRLGPYANAKEPNQLCTTLKPQGFDCLVVTQ